MQPYINGMPNPIWIMAANEANRLRGLGDSRCRSIGDALDDMLDRGGLFVRNEGPVISGNTATTGRYDPLSGGLYYLPVQGEAYYTTGEMWIAPGDYISSEDGSAMSTVDLIRHEAAHALIDWDRAPEGNALILDANAGSTFTAQQAASQCR